MLWWYTWAWVEPRLNDFLYMRADLIEDHGQHMDRWDKCILVSMKTWGWHIANDGEGFMDLNGAHRELVWGDGLFTWRRHTYGWCWRRCGWIRSTLTPNIMDDMLQLRWGLPHGLEHGLLIWMDSWSSSGCDRMLWGTTDGGMRMCILMVWAWRLD